MKADPDPVPKAINKLNHKRHSVLNNKMIGLAKQSDAK